MLRMFGVPKDSRVIGNRPMWVEDDSPLIIAEFGISHMGDFDALLRSLDEYLSADVYKFQLHDPDEMYGIHRHRNLIHETMLTHKQLKLAFRETRGRNKKVALTAFCPKTARIAANWYEEGLIDIIKVGSGECDNWLMAEAYQHRDFPINKIVSLGLRESDPFRYGRHCGVMHCVSEYPADEPNLAQMRHYQEEWGDVPVGFSDHSPSWFTLAGSCAAALGAAFIERHVQVTEDSVDAAVEDNSHAFKLYCESVRYAHLKIGKWDGVDDVDNEVSKWAKHVLVAREDIEAGDAMAPSKLTTARLDGSHYTTALYALASDLALRDSYYTAIHKINKGDTILWTSLKREW